MNRFIFYFIKMTQNKVLLFDYGNCNKMKYTECYHKEDFAHYKPSTISNKSLKIIWKIKNVKTFESYVVANAV